MEKDTERLWADYKGAFDAWALEVSRLQSGGALQTKDSKDLAGAVENYRRMRNRLADSISDKVEVSK